jgi:voltage-gated potassium channel
VNEGQGASDAKGSGSPSKDGAALVALLTSLMNGGGAGLAPSPDEGALGYGSIKREIKAAVAKDPFDATVVTVFGGAFLFYIAEKGQNPKVESYWDALVFISTCLSVGYHDVFARTPGGKAIATAVMTIGPALSGAIFDAPAAEKEKAEKDALAVQQAIVGTLGEILAELRSAKKPA